VLGVKLTDQRGRIATVGHQKWPKGLRSRWRHRLRGIRQVALSSICSVEMSLAGTISFRRAIPCFQYNEEQSEYLCTVNTIPPRCTYW